VQFFENEFRGHLAIQRQGGPHRTLVTPDGKSPILITDTVYHGPGVLFSRMTGIYDAVILIMHTAVEDGTVQVWHALMVKSPSGSKSVTAQDTENARMYQAAALGAFSQDFEVWANKRPCINGMFLPSDGAFRKARIWYKQFYNPRANKDEYLRQVQGIFVPVGMKPAPEAARGDMSLADAVAQEQAKAA
jgi:3-ketosteroid 9alpha-monooxygenase subunit A